MENLLTNLIQSLIGGVDSAINWAFSNLMDTCFNAEYNLTHNFGTQVFSIDSLKNVIFLMALSLIILKFLKKGFDIYILWTERGVRYSPFNFSNLFYQSYSGITVFYYIL